MRHLKPILAALILLAVAPLPGGSDAARSTGERGRLEVRIEGLRSRDGAVALALFGDRESFERRSQPLRAEFVPLKRKRCKWVVEDLPPGTYAVVAFHDKNGNRELDRRKMFGIPSEPYGFSNGARGKFGPPPFEDARFELAAGSRTITIRVR